ncbi:hypothetical protein [Spiroplasma endosymbiont of Amphibalanus improvisus]|uniref:hypothetical protein n=1 Tax=Spiroplasma endosymbiont of Amphibalanus improvisus TaxID=3066327 RepID=UPI00313E5C0A
MLTTENMAYLFNLNSCDLLLQDVKNVAVEFSKNQQYKEKIINAFKKDGKNIKTKNVFIGMDFGDKFKPISEIIKKV